MEGLRGVNEPSRCSPDVAPRERRGGGGGVKGKGGIASAQQRLCSRALRSREPPPPPPIPAVCRLFEVEPTCRKEAGIDWRHALGEECVTLPSRLLFLPFFPPSFTAPDFSLLLFPPPPTSPAGKPCWCLTQAAVGPSTVGWSGT